VSTTLKTKFVLASLTAIALCRPEALLACAACYGQSDSPLATAMNWGILTLLGFIVCVLGGIALFFVHVGRRTATARAGETSDVSDTKS